MSSRKKIPSIVKKYLMAITGIVMVLFVLGHMAGNLQAFAGPEILNDYAHKLQTLPYKLLWVVRSVLLLTVLVHVWMAILLTKENQAARPMGYLNPKTIQATTASKNMGVSGSILLLFIVFHILHYTARVIFPEFQSEAFYTELHGHRVYDVYKMMIVGFSNTWVSLFYIIAMICLSQHLSHGVSSMLQTLGLRNNTWRKNFDLIAKLYGYVIFLGFISVPAAVLISKYTTFKIFAL